MRRLKTNHFLKPRGSPLGLACLHLMSNQKKWGKKNKKIKSLQLEAGQAVKH